MGTISVDWQEQFFGYILFCKSIIPVFELFELTLEIAKFIFCEVLLEELVISVLFFVKLLVFYYLGCLSNLIKGVICPSIEK